MGSMKKVVKTLKQSLSILLAVAMVITCVPQTATLSLAASDTDIIDTETSTEAEAPAGVEVSTDDSGLVSDDETVIPVDTEEQPDTTGDDMEVEVEPTEDNTTPAEDDTVQTPDSVKVDPDTSDGQVTAFEWTGQDGQLEFVNDTHVVKNRCGISYEDTVGDSIPSFWFTAKGKDNYQITKVTAAVTGIVDDNSETVDFATDATEEAKKITTADADEDEKTEGFTKYIVPLGRYGFDNNNIAKIKVEFTTEPAAKEFQITFEIKGAEVEAVVGENGAKETLENGQVVTWKKGETVTLSVKPTGENRLRSVRYQEESKSGRLTIKPLQSTGQDAQGVYSYQYTVGQGIESDKINALSIRVSASERQTDIPVHFVQNTYYEEEGVSGDGAMPSTYQVYQVGENNVLSEANAPITFDEDDESLRFIVEPLDENAKIKNIIADDTYELSHAPGKVTQNGTERDAEIYTLDLTGQFSYICVTVYYATQHIFVNYDENEVALTATVNGAALDIRNWYDADEDIERYAYTVQQDSTLTLTLTPYESCRITEVTTQTGAEDAVTAEIDAENGGVITIPVTDKDVTVNIRSESAYYAELFTRDTMQPVPMKPLMNEDGVQIGGMYVVDCNTQYMAVLKKAALPRT